MSKPTRDPSSRINVLLKEPDPLKRKLLLLGLLSSELSQQGGTVFLVGGTAVELYTAGVFRTGDIDLTVTDKKGLESILRGLGFFEEGRLWVSMELEAAIDIVGTWPSRTEKARIFKIGDYSVKVEGVEDLIVDRLVSAKYWKSSAQVDLEQAVALLNSFDDLDLEYLRKRADEEKVSDFLAEASKT